MHLRRLNFFDNEDVGLEAAIIKRKRNSSLIEKFCAADVTGLKCSTEGEGVIRFGEWRGRRVFLSAVKRKREFPWSDKK